MNAAATKNLRKSNEYVLVPAEYAIFAKMGISPKDAADIAISKTPPILFLSPIYVSIYANCELGTYGRTAESISVILNTAWCSEIS